jgi:hypothetical protein
VTEAIFKILCVDGFLPDAIAKQLIRRLSGSLNQSIFPINQNLAFVRLALRKSD